MQFSTSTLLAFSAALSQAFAKVILTNTNWNEIAEGEPFTITWSEANGPVTLLLKDGPSSNLDTLATIATGQTGTSFTWTPSGIASGTYAIEIEDSSDVNYSSQFTYASTVAATPSSTPESTTAPTSSSPPSSTTEPSTTTDSSTTSSSSATSTTKNSTSSSSTSSSTRTSTGSATTSTNTPLNTNGSQKMGSPLALVFLTVAALMLCH